MIIGIKRSMDYEGSLESGCRRMKAEKVRMMGQEVLEDFGHLPRNEVGESMVGEGLISGDRVLCHDSGEEFSWHPIRFLRCLLCLRWIIFEVLCQGFLKVLDIKIC